MRYFLELAYDGAHFHGWQRQNNATSVQETLENALQTLLRLPTPVVAAGRTDTGVHAERQYVHFDWADNLPKNFLYKINSVLPESISVGRLLLPENQEFNARFDAVSRSYRYQIMREKSPFLVGRSLKFFRPLDVEKMQLAANTLLEYNDFASFCKLHGNNLTTFCEIYEARWEVLPQQLNFHVSSNRFLRGMVRALVGTLLEVGQNKLSIDGFRRIIEQKDRCSAAANVEPQGLFLCNVGYPAGAFTVLEV